MTVTTTSSNQPARRRHPLAHQRRQVVRELALGLKTPAQIAKEYNVGLSAIRQFTKYNAREIDLLKDALREKIADQLAGLWIANQGFRIALYQAIAEDADDPKDVILALKAVAEELGQMPARAQVVVMPVTHIVESVDLDLLR